MTDPNGLIRPGCPAPGSTLSATPDGRQMGPEQFRGCRLSPMDVNPGVDGILDALDRLAVDRQVVAG